MPAGFYQGRGRVQGLGISAGFSFSEAAEEQRVRAHLLAIARQWDGAGLGYSHLFKLASGRAQGRGMPTGFSGTVEECCDCACQSVLPW